MKEINQETKFKISSGEKYSIVNQETLRKLLSRFFSPDSFDLQILGKLQRGKIGFEFSGKKIVVEIV